MGACLSLSNDDDDGPDDALQASYSPLLFHPYIKGSQVIMDESCCTVSRTATFHDGIVFTNRPIEPYERVTVRILQEDQKWEGGLRVGFTWKDPCLQSGDLPPFVCPDLVMQGKTCACVVPDEYIAEGTIVSFWVDSQGCVFCSINLQAEEFFLFNGVSVESSLWAVMDIYGRTKAVQLLDSTCPETQESSAVEDCMVCFGSKANTMMMPCCHTGFCAHCSLKILRINACCPLCRQKVKKVLHVSILAERAALQGWVEKPESTAVTKHALFRGS